MVLLSVSRPVLLRTPSLRNTPFPIPTTIAIIWSLCLRMPAIPTTIAIIWSLLWVSIKHTYTHIYTHACAHMKHETHTHTHTHTYIQIPPQALTHTHAQHGSTHRKQSPKLFKNYSTIIAIICIIWALFFANARYSNHYCYHLVTFFANARCSNHYCYHLVAFFGCPTRFDTPHTVPKIALVILFIMVLNVSLNLGGKVPAIMILDFVQPACQSLNLGGESSRYVRFAHSQRSYSDHSTSPSHVLVAFQN